MGVGFTPSRDSRRAADILGISGRAPTGTDLPKWRALRSVGLHHQRTQAAEQLLLRAIVTAHDEGVTFQQIADHIGCAKSWAFKLYRKGLSEQWKD